MPVSNQSCACVCTVPEMSGAAPAAKATTTFLRASIVTEPASSSIVTKPCLPLNAATASTSRFWWPGLSDQVQ